MTRKCELCAGHKTRGSPAAEQPKPGRLRRILLGDRVVALCKLHAVEVRAKAPASVAELRTSFHEGGGQRSLLERRASADRRVFPARPEGRRASAGRRAGETRE